MRRRRRRKKRRRTRKRRRKKRRRRRSRKRRRKWRTRTRTRRRRRRRRKMRRRGRSTSSRTIHTASTIRIITSPITSTTIMINLENVRSGDILRFYTCASLDTNKAQQCHANFDFRACAKVVTTSNSNNVSDRSVHTCMSCHYALRRQVEVWLGSRLPVP